MGVMFGSSTKLVSSMSACFWQLVGSLSWLDGGFGSRCWRLSSGGVGPSFFVTSFAHRGQEKMPVIVIKTCRRTSIYPRHNMIKNTVKLLSHFQACVKLKSVISFCQDSNHDPYFPPLFPVWLPNQAGSRPGLLAQTRAARSFAGESFRTALSSRTAFEQEHHQSNHYHARQSYDAPRR
jgi:hypothetical protein